MATITRHPNGTVELKLHIPWADLDHELKKQEAAAVSAAVVPGFRKGKAPKKLVTPQLDQSQLLSKSLASLLPQIYSEAVTAHKLKPILYPQISIDKGKWGEDFAITATTCEAPVVTLPDNYAQALKKLEFKDPNHHLPTILEYLRNHAQVTIPEPLAIEEANHRLGHLAENITQLGLDMAKYLTSKKLTADELKAQTITAARADLELEFILGSIQAQAQLPDRKSTLDHLESLSKS